MKLIKSFYNSQHIPQKKPSNIKEGDIGLFAADGYTSLNSGLYYLKNAKVSSIGIIYKFLFSIKSNIICYTADFKKYKFRYLVKQILQAKKIKLDSQIKYIIVFDNYSGPKGFAHWLCDGLTRIAEVNDILNEYTVLVPEYFKHEKMYLESLSFFNIKKIEFLKSNAFTLVPNLYFPSHICETGNFNVENLKKLKNIVLTKINKNPFNQKFIYVSRAKANRRFIQNEQETCNLLKKYNFDIIYLEDYSFTEQVQIISQAKMVVSIHGAALSLIMFMKEGSDIMEIRNENDNINNMYYYLANASNINYYYLLCQPIMFSKSANNFNLIVDIPYLENELKQIIEKN